MALLATAFPDLKISGSLQDSPPRNLPLGNRIVTHTLHISLLTTRARRQSLIASIFPQSTSITRTDITKIATLPSGAFSRAAFRLSSVF